MGGLLSCCSSSAEEKIPDDVDKLATQMAKEAKQSVLDKGGSQAKADEAYKNAYNDQVQAWKKREKAKKDATTAAGTAGATGTSGSAVSAGSTDKKDVKTSSA